MTIDEKKFLIALARLQLTKGQLAEKACISRNRLNVVLNSKTVTPATIGRIARALDVDVTEILADE